MKNSNQSGFILMIVVMLVIVGFIVFLAITRIQDANEAETKLYVPVYIVS